jgi:iron complex transport system permease protein
MMKKNIILIVGVFLFVFILILYGESGWYFDRSVFINLRLPKIICAAFSGALLASAGLLMQIFFQNPIAGPDILGVSSGASLFVSFWVLTSQSLPNWLMSLGLNFFSFLGSAFVFLILIIFNKRHRTKVTLLILGILISSLNSSIVAILINSSQALQVKNYLLWTQGTFRNLVLNDLPIFMLLSILSLLPLLYFKKLVEQFALGESYAHTMGVNIKKVRTFFIILTSIYVSIVTLYCGPVGFIGIIAPHLARKYLGNGKIQYLIPANLFIGALLALFTELILTLNFSFVLSTNSVLGLIGAPILILYILKNREFSL